MPDLAQAIIQEIDLTHTPLAITKGVFGLSVITKRGKLGKPDTIMNSWAMFQKHFGGLNTNDGALICKRLFDRGGKARINRVLHYTDLVAGTTDAVVATMQNTVSITFQSDFVSLNSVLTTIDGTPSTAVVYSISSNNTLQAIANNIKNRFPLKVIDAKVMRNMSTGANNRIIVLTLKPGATITTITVVTTLGVTQPIATTAIIPTIRNAGGGILIAITPKGPGAEYNNLVFTISPPSNNTLGYFNLDIGISGDALGQESYTNLRLGAFANISQQTEMTPVVNSALINITTNDLTGMADRTPLYGSYSYSGGTDGSQVVETDYVGDSSGLTGFYAFDPYSDMTAIASPNTGVTQTVVTAGLTAYADNRKDLVGLHHIDNGLTTSNAIVAAVEATNTDSSYVGFYGGGNMVAVPGSGTLANISEIGDIMGLMSYTHTNFGMQYSFAGQNRGLVYNSQGPVNNFGTQAKRADLAQLANARVNMLINRDGRIMLWGNFTGQRAYSALSFMSVRLLVIEIKKTLTPILNSYLEEPNEPDTWLKLYYEIKPYFRRLAESKALQGIEGKGWSWQGDQFVTNMDDLQINNATDVGLGKYVVNLFIKPINSLQSIKLSVILTPGGISFDEAAVII